MALKKNPKFDLKLKYRKTLETSLIVTLVLLIAAFKFFPKHEKIVIEIYDSPDLIKVVDVEHTKQYLAQPSPPKPPIPIEAPTEKETLTEKKAEDYFFTAVEEMPEPIGGIGAIQRKIVYPEIARRVGIEGRVFVKVFVDSTGTVVKTELLKGIGAGCDEAAMDAVLTTKFKPGKQRGKPVKVRVTVPVRFKLQ